MKRVFAALGKALVYFLIFLVTQTVVTILYSGAYAIVLLPDTSDPYLLAEELLAHLDPALLLSNLVIILIYLLIAPMRRRSLRAHFDLEPMDRRGILPLILLGFSYNLALNVLLGFIPFPESWWEAYEASAELVPMDFSVISILSTAIVGPIAEELCFRGLMYTRLKSAMPAVLAALLSAAVFGAVHGAWIWFVYAFPLGLVMVWVFHRFRSLWASILLHIAFNLVNFLLLPVPESALPALSVIGCILTAASWYWICRLTKPAAPNMPDNGPC